MDIEYQLGFKDEWITICRESFHYKSEDILLFSLESDSKFKRDRNVEQNIRDLYAIHSGRYDSASEVTELLKLLLANGFTLKSFEQKSQFTLIKCFFPVVYVASSFERTVTIGDYWETTTTNPLTQLKRYCNWQDQLTGVKNLSFYLLNQIFKSGYQIIARNRNQVNTILELYNK